MYRPNFCAECGEQIARLRWRVWTSRRFCPACERRGGRMGRIARGLAACVALIGAGYAGGRLMRPAEPPLIIERGASNASVRQGQTAASAARGGGSTAGGASNPAPAAPSYGADGTAGERPTDPAEVVSICGARTRRGTPCSRRVRGTGRCWQHRGRAAMLPASKLIVED